MNAPDPLGTPDPLLAALIFPDGWEAHRVRLEQIELARGSIPNTEWLRVADACSISKTEAQRLYRLDRKRGADGQLMTDGALATICRLKDVKDAWRERRVAKLITCEYHTFWRAWRTVDPAIRKGLMKGVRAAKKDQIFARYPTVGRNVLRYGDNTMADNYVRDHRGLFRPWHAFQRDAHTGWMWMAVIDSDPDTETQITLLADTTLGETLPDGTFIGGVAGAYRPDRGGDLMGDRLVETLGSLGTTHVPCRPYEPWTKGKVEDGLGFYLRKLSTSCPGRVTTDFEGQRDPWNPADGRLLTFDEYVDRAFEVLRWFNTEWRSETFGFTTALERWQADTTPIHLVEADKEAEFASLFLRSKETRKVSKNGIRFRNGVYLSNEMLRFKGEQVQLGYSEHDRSFIHIFRDGKWSCRVPLISQYTAADGGELRRKRDKQISTLKRLQLMAAAQKRAGAAEGRASSSKTVQRDLVPVKPAGDKAARAMARHALQAQQETP